MVISKKRKFIFIHIYKNAGTSISKSIAPFAENKFKFILNKILQRFNINRFGTEPYGRHTTTSDLIKKIGRSNFDSFFSFAIVRNPWDWQVSFYNYVLKKPDHHQHNLIKKLGSFEKYIKWRCSEEVVFQKDFIYSENGELLVDFVGKIENIDKDFKIICSNIGIKASLPKLNVSNTIPYQQYYTDETEELVRKTFDADISLFGYEF